METNKETYALTDMAYATTRRALGLYINTSPERPTEVLMSVVDTSNITINAQKDVFPLDTILRKLGDLVSSVIPISESIQRFGGTFNDEENHTRMKDWYNHEFMKRTGYSLQEFLEYHFDDLSGRQIAKKMIAFIKPDDEPEEIETFAVCTESFYNTWKSMNKNNRK